MRIVVIGAGGHAQVIIDATRQMASQGQNMSLVACVDDDARLLGKRVLGVEVIGAVSELHKVVHDVVVVAIGDNRIRKRIYDQMIAQGETFMITRHPSAIVAPDALIGLGTVICAGAIINTGSQVGANAIINTGSSVDHHNVIGDHVHIAPGVHLGGNVTVGASAFVGIGATVIPGICIGSHSVVGAGACVIRDVADGVTVVGVPAKQVIRGQQHNSMS